MWLIVRAVRDREMKLHLDGAQERKARRTIGAILVTGALLIGCAESEGPPPSIQQEPTIDTPPAPSPEADLQETSMVTIMIEGMPEEIEVRRTVSPADFPLGFETIVPTDMVVDFVSSGAGESARFEVAFGGVRNPDAAFVLYVHPAGGDQEDFDAIVDAAVDSFGGSPRLDPIFTWADSEFSLTGEYSGFLATGEREGRYFYFILSYPPEYGDGMGPRIDLIMRSWRWADGSHLMEP